ncbi:MAG: polysaccharide deacetylase family protein [Planctomycetota bacterium]
MSAAEPVYFTTSWDDGHPGDRRIAELLGRHGLRGTFYMPRSFKLPTIDPREIASMGEAFEVGGHTIHHVELDRVDDATAEREITDARAWVSDRTGQACRVFCPPKGRFHRRHTEMMSGAGYAGFRTVELWSVDRPRTRQTPGAGRGADGGVLREMPTSVQVFPIRHSGHLRNLAKRRAVRNLGRFTRNGSNTDWLTAARRVLRSMSGRGGVFHLWGHAWEVDAIDGWADLDRFFGEVAASREELGLRVVTNGELVDAFSGDRQAG